MFLETARYSSSRFTCHIFRHFSRVLASVAALSQKRSVEYFGKKTSREKRRISDGGGGYGKRLNEIPLALGCTAWQSDTPPTSNRVIRRLPGPYPRLTTSRDRLPASLSDLLHELKRKGIRRERGENAN